MVAAILMVGTLGVTVMYNQHSLKAARQDSVATTFLTFSSRLQETLYGVLERDSEILKEVDVQKLKPYQFQFYRMFDIFADQFQMRSCGCQPPTRQKHRTGVALCEV